MAEEFQLGSGNWWESSSSSSSRLNHRFESSSGSSSSSTAAISSTQNDVSMESSGFIGCWPTHLIVDSKPKSSLDSVSAAGGGGDAALLSHHGFHNIMGLGLSPQQIPCWNNNNIPSLFSNANASFQQDCSSSYDYDKQMNRLSLDQPQPTPPLSSLEGSTASSDLDRTASAVLQPESSPMNFSYDVSQNYGMKPGGGGGAVIGDITSPTWSKFPQFLRPRQPQFSNNTTFWNAAMNDDDAQFSLFPVDEKPKNISAGQRDSSTATKTAGCTETSSKRPRDQNDTATPMPAFKVRKEKMGDRITALQQLISPFGKTDTASVLSEAIEYIKFLHDQVNVLSTPYLKSGASMRHQLNFEKSKNPETASGQDLRSRGLCLVPISSTMTFPLTPTFGGCFR
ncbi:PREDICTED: transcription factor bHLH112-like isoform X2 [Ipomoea nil]|uniref:transcription factor bHLH112-like isoform X2 n=1 Tax=Ipomoea nil TaxID=35883 RepID=UPI0009009E8D|nr:PREDICTED: transcription factor bHLH112-like isoform X2 [Ipomoea nil]